MAPSPGSVAPRCRRKLCAVGARPLYLPRSPLTAPRAGAQPLIARPRPHRAAPSIKTKRSPAPKRPYTWRIKDSCPERVSRPLRCPALNLGAGAAAGTGPEGVRSASPAAVPGCDTPSRASWACRAGPRRAGPGRPICAAGGTWTGGRSLGLTSARLAHRQRPLRSPSRCPPGTEVSAAEGLRLRVPACG